MNHNGTMVYIWTSVVASAKYDDIPWHDKHKKKMNIAFVFNYLRPSKANGKSIANAERIGIKWVNRSRQLIACQSNNSIWCSVFNSMLFLEILPTKRQRFRNHQKKKKEKNNPNKQISNRTFKIQIKFTEFLMEITHITPNT